MIVHSLSIQTWEKATELSVRILSSRIPILTHILEPLASREWLEFRRRYDNHVCNGKTRSIRNKEGDINGQLTRYIF